LNNQNYVISNTKKIKKLLKHIWYYRLVSITFILATLWIGNIIWIIIEIIEIIIKIINGTYIFSSTDVIEGIFIFILFLFSLLIFRCAVFLIKKYLRSIVLAKDFKGKDIIILQVKTKR
jgi:hypothetical protein